LKMGVKGFNYRIIFNAGRLFLFIYLHALAFQFYLQL
jgi:hypothetical protein